MEKEYSRKSVRARKCPRCALELDLSVTICPRDGTRVIDLSQLGLAKYEILEQIGTGGMGVVYKARQLHLNRLMAVKMLHSHLLNPKAMQRFQREAKAASLLSHPNLVAVHDFGILEETQPYMVMEYVEGATLAQVLTQDGALSITRFRKIFLQVCAAMEYAHSNAILHRDIKPGNLMLINPGYEQEEVKILDFGLAKLVNENEELLDLTKTGETIGSPVYMSPEQASGDEIDHRTDLYSLGCVMYETLTGAPPFVGKSILETLLKQLHEVPIPLKEASLGRELPPALEELILKLLQKNPGERYQSMHAVYQDLEALELDKVVHVKRDTQPALAVVAPANCSQAPNVVQEVVGLDKHPKSSPQSANSKQSKLPPGISLGWVAISVICMLATGAALYTLYSPLRIASAPIERPKLQFYDQSNRDSVKWLVKSHSKSLKLPALNVKDSDLEPVRNATDVVDINLCDNPKVSDTTLEYINHLPLVELRLSGTDVTNLSALRGMATLKTLDISRTRVTDAGFAPVSSLVNLQNIDLRDTKISNKSLARLAHLKHLEYMTIANCPNITTAALDDLRAQLPAAQAQMGNRLRIQQKYKEAETCYRRALQLTGGAGFDQIEYGRILRSLAATLITQHRGVEAERYLKEACEIFQSVPNANLEETGQTFLLRADNQATMSKFAPAKQLYLECQRYSSHTRQDPIANAGFLMKLGTTCDSLHEYDEAEKLLKQSITILRSQKSPPREQLRSALFLLSSNLYVQKKYAEAEAICKETLELSSLDNPEFLATLNILTSALAMQNKLAEQESIIRTMLARAEQENPFQSKQGLIVFLANAVFAQHRFAEAESLYRRALELSLKADPKTTIEGEIERQLAYCLHREHKFSEARSFYTSALKLFKEIAPKSTLLPETLQQFGSVLKEEGCREEGVSKVRAAAALWTAIEGKGSAHVADCNKWLNTATNLSNGTAAKPEQ